MIATVLPTASSEPQPSHRLVLAGNPTLSLQSVGTPAAEPFLITRVHKPRFPIGLCWTGLARTPREMLSRSLYYSKPCPGPGDQQGHTRVSPESNHQKSNVMDRQVAAVFDTHGRHLPPKPRKGGLGGKRGLMTQSHDTLVQHRIRRHSGLHLPLSS